MQSWITAAECKERFPGWLELQTAGWNVKGLPFMDEVVSQYGGFMLRVYLNKDGTPNHVKGIYFEAPNGNNVVWDKDDSGVIFIGCTIEERGFADAPGSTIQNVIPADPPIKFFQPCVMGFADKVFGKELGGQLKSLLEIHEEDSIRESREEMGITEIRSIEPMGVVWPNATNTATVTVLYDIWVDMTKVIENPNGREWSIKNCIWLPVREVIARIAAGSHEELNCRMGQANTTFFTWLCRHPEALDEVI